MAETRKRQTAKSRSKKASTARSSSAKRKSTAKRPSRAKASATTSSAKRTSTSTSSHDTVCNVSFCPICQAAKATQSAGPEAFGHLVAAAREFFLAAKVVVEAMPKDPSDWRPGGNSGSGTNGSGKGSGASGGSGRGKLQKISVS